MIRQTGLDVPKQGNGVTVRRPQADVAISM
jgi:hypothetical protein